MALPLVIAPGDPNHIAHHEEIHELLSRLDGQNDFLASGVYQDVVASLPVADAGNLGLFRYATDVDTLDYSDGTAWHQVAMEDSANTFTEDQLFGSGRPWYDIQAYGAVADGATPNAVAIQAAIDAAKLTGGIVWIPYGLHDVEATLDLDDAWGVTIKGASASPKFTDVLHLGSFLRYTAASGELLTINSSQHVTLEDVGFVYNNAAYNGNLVSTDWSAAASDPAYLRVNRCRFSGSSTASGARSLLRLNRLINSSVRDSAFAWADIGILGRDGSYSNVITISGCAFPASSITTAKIKNAGETWLIEGCTFEPNVDGKAASYLHDSGTARGLVIQACWFGDVSVTGNPWIDVTGGSIFGLVLSGNRVATAFGGAVAENTFLRFTSGNCQGLTIIGNRIETYYIVDYGVTTTTRDVFIGGNDSQTAGGILNEASSTTYAYWGNANLANKVSSGVTFSSTATFGGLVTMKASSSSSAGLNLPHGSAPSAPVNGDIWTTTAGLYVRINGATVGPLS